MIFFSPIWLLLQLPLAAAMYLWRLPTRGLNLVRFIIILLLVLAMAQPAMKLKDQQGTVVVLIDRSESMPPKAADDQLEVLKSLHGEMGSEDRLAVVSFGDRTIIEQEPSDQATETLQSPADQQHSRLNDGLEAALSLIPPTHPGRILVVSDGHWTGRDPNAVTARAAGRDTAAPAGALRSVRSGLCGRAGDEAVAVGAQRGPAGGDGGRPRGRAARGRRRRGRGGGGVCASVRRI